MESDKLLDSVSLASSGSEQDNVETLTSFLVVDSLGPTPRHLSLVVPQQPQQLVDLASGLYFLRHPSSLGYPLSMALSLEFILEIPYDVGIFEKLVVKFRHVVAPYARRCSTHLEIACGQHRYQFCGSWRLTRFP